MATGAELQFLISMRDQASATIRQLGGGMTDLGSNAQNAAQRMREFDAATRQAAVGVGMLFGAVTAGKAALDTFGAYDKTMTVIQRTTMMSSDAMADFSKQFDELSGKMRATPVSRLQEITVQAAQLGITGTNNILRFTETMAKLESSLVDLGTDAPKFITRVLNATGEGIEGVERFGNVLTQLAKGSSSAESTILSMTATLAQSTARFKVASEALLGFSTAAADLNFQPDLFGSAVGRTLTQIQDAAINDSQAFRDLAAMTKLTRQEWLDLLKNDPTQAMIRFAEVVKKIGADGKSTLAFYTSLNLQSDENRRVTDTMAANIDKFRQAQEEARTEAQRQIATNQEFQTTLKAYNVQVQAASNAWTLFSGNVGRALAPAATVALQALTTALEGASSAFRGMPDWAQQTTAWAAVVTPAVVGVIATFSALRTVMMLTGTTAVLTAGLTGITTFVAGLMAAVANLTRAVALVAALSRIGPLITPIIAAFGGIAGAIAAIPVGIAAASIAIGAALGFIAKLVYDNWQSILAWFRQPIGDIISQAWGGATGAIASILSTFKTTASDLWDDVLSIFKRAPAAPQEGGLRAVVEAQLAATRALIETQKTVLANQQTQYTLPGQSQEQYAAIKAAADKTAAEINRVQLIAAEQAKEIVRQQINDLQDQLAKAGVELARLDPTSAMTTKATQALEILRAKVQAAEQQLAKLNAMNAPAKVIGIPGGLAGGVKLPDTTVGDTRPVSTLSEVYQKDIQALDNFSKNLKKVNDQTVAFQALLRAPADDRFFKDLGLSGAEVEQYKARLQGLLEMERLRADPVQATLKALREQTMAAAALTAEEKNQLEVAVNLRQEKEKKGALTEAETQAIREQTALLQAQRADTALRQNIYDSDKALAAAKAITQEQKNQTEILAKINDYEREHGKLSEAQRNTMAAQLGSLQQIQQFNTLRDSLNPIGTAGRKFADDVLTLNKALSDGTVTLEQYNMLMRNLKTSTLEQRDPFAAQVKSMKEQIELQRISGEYQEADRQTLQTIVQFREKGLDLTKDQVAALSDYNRAMQDASKAQSSGLEGWARQVGSMKDNVLDLQKELVTSFSSSLTDAITGANGTWTKFLTGITRSITSMMVNQFLKSAFEGTGMLGAESGSSFKKASDAADKLSGLASGQLNTMNVTATTVNLGGAGAISATGLAGAAGAGVGGAAGTILSGNAVAQSVQLLKKFEGFITTAKYDVNAYRTGYGSDTKTDAITGAVTRVTQATTVTKADAEADLARRIPEFQKTIQSQIGGVWESLTDNVKAALTSVAYNYGHLPSSVQKAALTGNAGGIADAIAGLQGANGGINRNRRLEEAAIARGNGQSAVSEVTNSQGITGRIVATLDDPQTVRQAVASGTQSGVIGAATNGTVQSQGGLASLFSGMDIPKIMSGVAGAVGLFGTYAQGAQAKSGGMAAIGGAISGASSGFMLGSQIGAIGGPMGAVGGALIGGLLSFLGFGDSKKKQKEEEQKKAMQDYINNLTKINQLIASNNGDPKTYGRLGNAIAQLEDQTNQAEQIAGKAGQWGKVAELTKSFNTAVERLKDEFGRSWGLIVDSMIKGFGMDGPAAQAAANMQALVKSLQGFVYDTGDITQNDPNRVAMAQYAAQQELLQVIDPPKALSEIGKRMEEIRGSSGELVLGLTKLGMTAEQAAKAVQDKTVVALQKLRDAFNEDVGAKLNTAQGKGYLNDAKDLIKEVADMNADASLIGGDVGQVDQYFTAAAQRLVDQSQLVGGAFDELVQRFPELQGRVHEFSEDGQKSAEELAKAAAQALSEIQDRKRGYEDRYVAATFGDNKDLWSKQTIMARNHEWEQWTELAKGGQGMDYLLQAQQAEYDKMIRDYYAEIAARNQTYSNRQWQAQYGDNQDLGSRLAGFDRNAMQERQEEVRNGGQAMVALEAAQAAERWKIVQAYYEAVNDRIRGFNERYYTAIDEQSTLAGKLAAFQRQAAQEQIEEAKAGGEAMGALLQAQGAEQQKIINDYMQAIKDRQTGFQDRAFAATNDGTTLAGQLAAFERQAQKDRAAEIKLGGEAINDLTIAQEAERAKIIADYYEAVNQRIKSFDDRLFAATNDATTLAGQLAAFDRNAATERVNEIKSGGEALNALMAAQNAERQKLIDEYNKAIAERRLGYQDRAFTAGNDGTTLAGQLAAFERQANKERLDEIKAGGEAINDLTLAQEAERAKIIADYYAAVQDRIKGYDDRLFAAGLDTTTLAGQLAAFDRNALAERAAEMKAGGEAIVQLEAAQAAERLKVISDFNKSMLDQAKNSFKNFVDGIKKYIDGLKAGGDSPLSPAERLAEARKQYSEQLALANSGNLDAINGITGYSDQLLQAAKAYYASSQDFQDIFNSIIADLTGLSSNLKDTDFLTPEQKAAMGLAAGGAANTNTAAVQSFMSALNDNVSVQAQPTAAQASAGSDNSAIITELKGLREELKGLRGDVQLGNQIADAGHMENVRATDRVRSTIGDGNREQGRQALRRA